MFGIVKIGFDNRSKGKSSITVIKRDAVVQVGLWVSTVFMFYLDLKAS